MLTTGAGWRGCGELGARYSTAAFASPRVAVENNDGNPMSLFKSRLSRFFKRPETPEEMAERLKELRRVNLRSADVLERIWSEPPGGFYRRIREMTLQASAVWNDWSPAPAAPEHVRNPPKPNSAPEQVKVIINNCPETCPHCGKPLKLATEDGGEAS